MSLLTSAILTCQSYNLVSLQMLVLVFTLPLQVTEGLGVHPRSLGRGRWSPSPPALSPPPHHCYPVVGAMNYSCPGRRGCLLLPA